MNNSDEPVVARPAGIVWMLVAMALVTCLKLAWLAFSAPNKNDEVWLVWLVGSVPGATALGLILYMTRHRVIADADGLRWRGAFTNWKSARWDEITDFYDNSPHVKAAGRTVETRAGRLTLRYGDGRADEVAARVAARALCVPFRAWGARGLRAGETFESRFAARAVSGRAFGITWAVLTAIIAWLLAFVLRDSLAAGVAGAPSFVGWHIGALLMMATLTGVLLSVFVAPIVGVRYLGEGEWVVATERGLRFEARGRDLEIAWDELRAVHLFAARAQFETARGNWQGYWSAELRPIIERYAPHAHLDAAINEADFARPIAREGGAVFYPFRTDPLRFLLLIYFAPLVLPVVLTLIVQGFTPDWDWPSNGPMATALIPLALAGLWGWRLYWRGGVAVSEAGIETRGAWRARFYRWDEISACGGEGTAFWIRVGARRLKLWRYVQPVRRDEVRAAIEARVGFEMSDANGSADDE